MSEFEQQHEVVSDLEGGKIQFKRIAEEMEDKLKGMGIEISRQDEPHIPDPEHAKDDPNLVSQSPRKKVLIYTGKGQYKKVYPG